MLLARARDLGAQTFLTAVAASFREACRMVDTIMQAATQRPDAGIKLTSAEDVM